MTRFKTHIQLILIVAILLGGESVMMAVAAVTPQITALDQIRGGFVSPTRLELDAQGNFYVLDARKKAVFKFDKYGNKSDGIQIFNAIPASGGGLAVSSDGTLLLVAKQTSVAIINGTTGTLLGYLGGKDRFSHIRDIDIDDKGYVFVADAGQLKIEVFRPDRNDPGSYIYDYQFGVKGIEAGQFMGISAMDINVETGEIYIADPYFYKPEGATTVVSYPKVQVYDLSGNLKKAAGGPNDFILPGSKSFGAKETIYFGGMTFDDQGRGYFTDSYNGRINVLAVRGTDPLKMYLSSYTTTGYAEGQLSDPRDVAYDPVTGRLFVLCGDGRIEVFSIDGATSPTQINQAPAVPKLISPIGGSEVSVTAPQLRWQPSQDSDKDAVVYRVKIGKQGAESKIYEEISATSLTIPNDLEENALYTWSAQAADNETGSDWSDSQGFYVNAFEEAPSAPLPVAPQTGVSVDGQSVFAWQAAGDPDPLESIHYVFQISGDTTFAHIVWEKSLAGMSLTLNESDGYSLLEDGKSYFWRVKAIDSTGLESPASKPLAFTCDSTTLKVTANVSGARVYLGGNLGFPGQLVGETPMELRDLPTGFCSIVVENAGFEPAVAQVEVLDKVDRTVHLTLIPALTPNILTKDTPIQAASAQLRIGSASTPFLADYDNDGITDLLVGSAAGSVILYRGNAANPIRFAAGEVLALPVLVPGAVPILVDWNNDLHKDLLVGAADGTVLLFLNIGTEQTPVFSEGVLLVSQGSVLDVGADAVPVVVDLDEDGHKDLILGSDSGIVAYYHNVGADENPELVYSANLVSPQAVAPVAPFVVDWNGDSRRDLLVYMEGRFYSFLRQADGTFAEAEPIATTDRLGGGSPHCFFAADINGANGKDLLVGGSNGEVHFLKSTGKVPTPAFTQFMQEKLAGLAKSSGDNQSLNSMLQSIESLVRGGNYRAAGRRMKRFRNLMTDDDEKSSKIMEFYALLVLAGKIR